MRFSMMPVMIMKGLQGAMVGTTGLRRLTGSTTLMRCRYKTNSRIANDVRVTCHTHVPCHIDRVSGLLNVARIIVSKVIVLSIVRIVRYR